MDLYASLATHTTNYFYEKYFINTMKESKGRKLLFSILGIIGAIALVQTDLYNIPSDWIYWIGIGLGILFVYVSILFYRQFITSKIMPIFSILISIILIFSGWILEVDGVRPTTWQMQSVGGIDAYKGLDSIGKLFGVFFLLFSITCLIKTLKPSKELDETNNKKKKLALHWKIIIGILLIFSCSVWMLS
jgi:hypothetical protein